MKDVMWNFHPDLNTELTIEDNIYRFLPHPLLSDEVHMIPRERATTFQLVRPQDKSLWALKVTHVGYRDPRITKVTQAIKPYRHLPGLTVANRFCLTSSSCPDLIAQYPLLEHAIVMPWIAGKTWAGFLDDPHASASYTADQAYQLALTTAHILWNLEMHHLAHTDIAGDNVVLLSFKQVELIDIEGCYIPRIPPPKRPSRGWQGYQHRLLDQQGNYRPDGDRFAGAMLLTEMLTWWNPVVRAVTPEKCDALLYLQQDEPTESKERRLVAIRNTLWTLKPALCRLFDQAWASSDLADCPDFGTWALYLLEGKR